MVRLFRLELPAISRTLYPLQPDGAACVSSVHTLTQMKHRQNTTYNMITECQAQVTHRISWHRYWAWGASLHWTRVHMNSMFTASASDSKHMKVGDGAAIMSALPDFGGESIEVRFHPLAIMHSRSIRSHH